MSVRNNDIRCQTTRRSILFQVAPGKLAPADRTHIWTVRSNWCVPIGNIAGAEQYFLVNSDVTTVRITSLSGFALKKPFKVKVACLGDHEFMAELPELNMAMTGTTIGEALTMLKDYIQIVYRRYRSKNNLGPEPSKQFSILEQHIGEEKRK